MYVFEECEKAREKLLSIHDINFKTWGIRKAREIGDHTFQASEHWLWDFKRRHGICSRKITKLVTKREIESKEEIKQSADEFIQKFLTLLPKYKPENVLNTDQSGLELEVYSNRTLSMKGEKITLGLVGSVHNTMHSYTVQPLISLSGHQIGPLFLCLKEPSGHLSDKITKDLFQAQNIVLTCSKSGKLTTSLVDYWVKNVLVPILRNKYCLLLSDWWGGQRDQQLYSSVTNLTRLELPKKTTSMIQPLDVFYNRQFKRIVRAIYDRVRLYALKTKLHLRDNIIKLNSLVYNQLSSDKFTAMLRYAWYKSGYLMQSPAPFSNVIEVNFSFSETSCQLQNCNDSIPFIQCSFCDMVLCFQHFFDDYHMH